MKNSLKNTAYEYIRSKITNCELMPLSFIDAAQISRELGSSRTPVRDALTQLESEGLVVITPRRGIMVADIPADEVSSIARVRRLFEPYIVSVACEKADTKRLREFRDRFSSVSSQKDQISSEYDFNLYLTGLTENEYIIQTMERVYVSNFRVQILGKMPTGSLDNILNLIDCISRRDPERANAAVMKLISEQGIY
ncbi:MAG: GntR family transcriptional regulator [Oscillospiraceae bacterium]|nr:GntR family transcriptional regulator [Oscillospiraceae bacterium]